MFIYLGKKEKVQWAIKSPLKYGYYGKQQGRLIDLFVAGATAGAAAEIVGVNRSTARVFYHWLRQLIARRLPSYALSGEVEADESYFGGVRKGRRGRAAAGKVPVFGLLQQGGKVFTAIIPNTRSRRLLPIIREDVTLACAPS